MSYAKDDPRHGSDGEQRTPYGWQARCLCGWLSDYYTTGPEGDARAGAIVALLGHHRWWNQHPNLPLVGARRENVE